MANRIQKIIMSVAIPLVIFPAGFAVLEILSSHFDSAFVPPLSDDAKILIGLSFIFALIGCVEYWIWTDHKPSE